MIIRIMYISCKKGMMKALKKNQIVIFAIALMLITAGYLNYTMQTEQTAQTSGTINNEEMAGIGDAKLVSTDLNNAIPQNNVEQKNDVANTTNNTVNADNKSKTENSVNQSSDVKNQTDTTKETTTTSAKETTDTEKYFAESKLERENMYGLRFSNIVKQFVTFENSNISYVISSMGYKGQYLSEKLNKADAVSLLKFSDEEKSSLQKKYINIIFSDVNKKSYSKTLNSTITLGNGQSVTTTAYSLVVNKNELDRMYKRLLSQLAEDEIILN